MKKKYDTMFVVVWNATRRTFDIHQDGKPTGSFARDRNTAIGLATQAGKFEARDGRSAAVFSTNADGKQIVEWSS